ncbi:hypothetical protein BC941DRAFT_419090 [Chlamydoabsidia padenii]|nr:hypothetical protein BC941DRAFT_419090 [Chlamydoabsidia padenii]
MSRSSRNSEKRSSRNDFYRGDDKTERRALFNPQSDHPISFNKPLDNSTNIGGGIKTQQRRQRQGIDRSFNSGTSSSSSPGVLETSSVYDRPTKSSSSSPAPTRPSRGVLWDPNNINSNNRKPTSPTVQRAQLQQKERQPRLLSEPTTTTTTIVKEDDTTTCSTDKAKPTPKTKETAPGDAAEMDEHRSRLKMLLNRIQKLETKVTQLSEKTLWHPYFLGIRQENGGKDDGDHDTRNYCNDDDDTLVFNRGLPDHSRRTLAANDTTKSSLHHPWLRMTVDDDDELWESTDHVWKDKMALHLQLANAYLDVIRFDYGFAEKKNLFSLCWKRAIYSLVEQFRQAFRRQQMLTVVVNAMVATAAAADSSTTTATPSNQQHRINSDDDSSSLDGLDDDDNDDNGDFIPVMTENGMTMVQLSDDDDNDDGGDDVVDKKMLQRILNRHLQMLRTWMDTFLLVADDFYQQAMVVLWDLDKSLLSLTSDGHDLTLATSYLETSLLYWRRTKRWKWYQCIPYRGDLARYRFIYGQKKKDYELAWRWYTLGVWLIPATGRFYFHQSLLLNSPHYSTLYELHKLYFGVRSLMVRRNGFVNAREGLVTLFENNRQWQAALAKKTKTKTKSKKNDGSRKQQGQRRRLEDSIECAVVEPDKMIAGLFIRLHGMVFTKIDLDFFAQTKRCYFETLFGPISQSPSVSPGSTTLTSSSTLSCQQLFWLETILLNLSSLYSYDYVSSNLTKAITLNKKCWILPGDDQQQQDLAGLLETLNDSILFGHSIDLVCQLVVELLSRYMKDDDHSTAIISTSPCLPALPHVSLTVKSNEVLLFGTTTCPSENGESNLNNGDTDEDQGDSYVDNQPWLVYIYVLLHWMVVTGVGVRSRLGGKSIWEMIIGQVASTEQQKANDMDKITHTFWSLMMAFFTRTLKDLPETSRYQLIDRHLLDSNNPWAGDDEDEQHHGDIGTWDTYLLQLMGSSPVLPEDECLRGLGWLDDLFVTKTTIDNHSISPAGGGDSMAVDIQRRIMILEFGFTLVKQMHQVLEYDPVQETFMVKPNPEESMMDETEMLPILTALDDAVLFDTAMPLDDNGDGFDIDNSNKLDGDNQVDDHHNGNNDDNDDNDDGDDDDDMVGQLKKRRQHLQSMLATMTREKNYADTYGYQELNYSNRGKERVARLNRIREKVIPGQTVLVLDTNCFIGHFNAIRRLIQGGAWSIVIPLVVITELDGLKGNAPPLSTVAGNALELIETTLAASKQLRRDMIRIQTSRHNFMHDISIRSEQLDYSENNRNLDDLILSTCLWWKNNKKALSDSSPVVPVCLVTADRNLSVKARARDVQVIPVSGLMEINPGSRQP